LTDSLFSQIIEHGLKKAKGKILQDLRLSKLEREVLLLVGDGFSSEDIASTLKIKPHSVKSLIHNILEKLAFQSRIQTSRLIPAGKRAIKSSPTP
jgi:DNA-binding CsgD family transcriptional regulator